MKVNNKMSIFEKKLSGQARPIEFNGEYDIEAFNRFNNKFNEWIYSSNQKVNGLPKNRYIVSGLTDAFNQTYSMYNKIGIFDGEYNYHKLVFPDRVTTKLEDADVIIISHPFSADGECSHHRIAEADKLNIPIFIDCAFYGICVNIDFDFSKYKNIHSVGFSLSKTFGTGWYRVGLLYTIDFYPVSYYTNWNYPLLASAEQHYNLINKYNPDDMYNKYKDQQKILCSKYKLLPSSTVIFGLDYTDKYKEFKRGPVNRICLSDRKSVV